MESELQTLPSYSLDTAKDDRVIGFTNSFKSSEIVVTYLKSGVKIYDVNEQQCTHHWSFPRKIIFETPVVCTQGQTQPFLYGVLNDGKTIYSWQWDATDLNDGNVIKKEFSFSIFKVFPTKHGRKKWLVVMLKNKTIHLCDQKLNIAVTAKFAEDDKLSFAWANVVSIDDNDHIFGILRDKKNNYELSIYTIYNEPNIRIRALHPLPTVKGTYLRVEVNNDPLSMTIFCTNRTLQYWKFPSSSSLIDSMPAPMLYSIDHQKLTASGAPLIQISNLFSIGEMVGIIGIRKEDSPPKVTLSFWDPKYHIFRDTVALPTDTINFVSLSTDNSTLIFSSQTSVYFCPISLPKSSLLSSIDKLSEKRAPNSIVVDLEKLINDSQKKMKRRDDVWKHLNAENKIEQEVIDALNDVNDWPTFREHLVAYINQNLYKEVYEDSQKQLTAWLENPPKTQKLSYNFISTVSKRCMQLKFLLPIKLFLKMDLLMNEMIPNFIPTLIQYNSLNLIETYLIYVSDTNEEDLILLLEYFLKDENSEIIENYIRKSIEPSIASTKSVDFTYKQFLNLIISIPINPNLIKLYVRYLDIQLVFKLLSYLDDKLAQFITPESLENEYAFASPSISDVMNWIELILDSHFTEILMSKNIKPIILSIQNSIKIQTQFCKQLSGLRGPLHQIISSKGVVAAKPSSYSIEVLHI